MSRHHWRVQKLQLFQFLLDLFVLYLLRDAEVNQVYHAVISVFFIQYCVSRRFPLFLAGVFFSGCAHEVVKFDVSMHVACPMYGLYSVKHLNAHSHSSRHRKLLSHTFTHLILYVFTQQVRDDVVRDVFYVEAIVKHTKQPWLLRAVYILQACHFFVEVDLEVFR